VHFGSFIHIFYIQIFTYRYFTYRYLPSICASVHEHKIQDTPITHVALHCFQHSHSVTPQNTISINICNTHYLTCSSHQNMYPPLCIHFFSYLTQLIPCLITDVNTNTVTHMYKRAHARKHTHTRKPGSQITNYRTFRKTKNVLTMNQ
jgi:hypothetical protein